MTRTAQEALAAAVREAAHPTWNSKGMCLKQVRLLLRVSSGAPSAIRAWEAVKPAHRHELPAPPGAPIFWSVGEHGHIGLAAGHGLVWSTDIRRPGRLDPVWVDLIQARWGAHCLGWTETLNGVRVPLAP